MVSGSATGSQGTRGRGRVCTPLSSPSLCKEVTAPSTSPSPAGGRSTRAPASRARAAPPPPPPPPASCARRARRPLAGALGRAGRAQGRGRGRRARARARAGGARRAGGAARCSHDGRGCVRSGQSRGRLRPPHPGAAAAHHPARRVLGVLHRGLRLHRERGLPQQPHGGRGVLRLQPQPQRLQLRRGSGRAGLPHLPALPGPGRLLPADQQRQGPQEGCPVRHRRLGLLGLPLVCGLLLPGQPVAGLQAQGQPAERGDRRCPGRHRLLLLLHLYLEPDRSPGRAQVQGPCLPGGVQHTVPRLRTALAPACRAGALCLGGGKVAPSARDARDTRAGDVAGRASSGSPWLPVRPLLPLSVLYVFMH